MDDISIGSLTFRLEELSLNEVNILPKSFVLEGNEYFFDHNKKPKIDPIKKILNINNLKDTGCRNPQGVCTNLECLHCYNKSLMWHPKGIYYSLKNDTHPRYLPLGSHKKILMNCDKCHHDFEIDPCHIKKGRWCPYCGHNKLCSNMSCYDCYIKSFVSSKRFSLWSPKNEISPRLVFRRSNKNYILYCKICNHEFIRKLNSENSCPYCTSKKLCTSLNCQFCFDMSFASIEYSKNWSPENIITPREFFKNSISKKYKFICPDCKHTFETLPMIISRGDSCNFCASKNLCDNNNCITCFNKSLASCFDIRYFSSKNNINPRMIFKGTESKYIFNCENCKEEYLTDGYHFAVRGQRCTCIINKTETKLYKYL